MFHSSSNTSEIRNDENESRATASAAAKVSEDMSVKDADILRLIEERRNTPKGDKHKLKDVSKCMKRCTRDKKLKRQMDIRRILEDFKRIRNIPGIKSAKKRVLITKIKNESRKGIAEVFGEFYKKFMTTMSKTNQNKN